MTSQPQTGAGGTSVASAAEASGGRAELLRVLAHELRNYIAPIHNAMHLLRLKSRADPAVAPVIDIIERQLSAMTRALDTVSDVDRLQRGELTLDRAPVAIAEVLARARQSMAALASARRQQVALDIPTTLRTIEADASRLTRTFAALLDNAARYAPEGSAITVTVREDDAGIEVRIEDEGPGFAPGDRQDALELFATPHRAGQGLGLGLPLAAAVVRLHGGELSIRDRQPRGTAVIVHLPPGAGHSASTGAAAGAQALPEAPGAGKRGRRVLIADDSAAVRISLSDLLAEMGHEVRAAADGAEAVAMAQAWQPEFVLLDIHMPRLNGMEAARKLRALFPRGGMQLVMMSGDDLDEVVRRGAQQAGFDHCVDKGLAIGELTQLLAR